DRAISQLAPLWVKSTHVQCRCHVRFGPKADIAGDSVLAKTDEPFTEIFPTVKLRDRTRAIFNSLGDFFAISGPDGPIRPAGSPLLRSDADSQEQETRPFAPASPEHGARLGGRLAGDPRSRPKLCRK